MVTKSGNVIVSVHKSQKLIATPGNVRRESLLMMTLGTGRNWPNMDSHLSYGWISITLCLWNKVDEFPLKERDELPFQSQLDDYKLRMKLRASFEWSLAKITKSMAPCRLTPVSTCQCPVHLPTYTWLVVLGLRSRITSRSDASLPHIYINR